MKKFIFLLSILLLSACSMGNVMNRPDHVGEGVIKKGTPRSVVLSQYGQPLETKTDQNGVKKDIFRVKQGDTLGVKATKTAGLLAIDIVTFGIAEVFTNPATRESGFVVFEAIYDKDDKIEKVTFIN